VRRPREPENGRERIRRFSEEKRDRGDAETGTMAINAVSMMWRELSWDSSCADEGP
jgi:hypothetical protein